MGFVSGRITACYQCAGPDIDILRESFDERERIWVGEAQCVACQCRMLYSRRAETPEEIEMAKGRKATRRPADKDEKPITHRVNKSNGHGALESSTEIAPKPEPEKGLELGPIQLPEGEDALKAALLELAEANDLALRAADEFAKLAEQAKKAKKKLDERQAEVSRKLKLYTHAADLPLFDAKGREADLTLMADGPEEAPEFEEAPF